VPADGTQAPAPASTPATTPAPPPLTGGSFGTLKDGYAANASEDLGAAC
jgi:polyisoprenyl-teichoic acid--peptidoglycan teichoic acid transferase